MIIGTCSECGGAVGIPDVWGGVIPPTPTCTRCGAVAANHGPVIPMIKPQSETSINWGDIVRNINSTWAKP